MTLPAEIREAREMKKDETFYTSTEIEIEIDEGGNNSLIHSFCLFYFFPEEKNGQPKS